MAAAARLRSSTAKAEQVLLLSYCRAIPSPSATWASSALALSGAVIHPRRRPLHPCGLLAAWPSHIGADAGAGIAAAERLMPGACGYHHVPSCNPLRGS